ncbi:common central domain of tyrosinase-domain-containing protein [Kalaharituber pfeilii]|nr:common central domain of tyrosinase-domain-containing protein [Kalaharituber pfeilii]
MASTSTLPVLPGPVPKKYSITGVITPDGPQVRRNILKLSDPKGDPSTKRQWNLFLQALTMFQGYDGKDAEDEATEDEHVNPTGYYQVAGIHGAPYIHWMEEPERGDRPGNYCTHGTAMFPTWHRPYVLLFEQRIVEEALKYASKLHKKYKDIYMEDAKKLRMPFWDWSTDYRLPEPVTTEYIDITLPLPGSDAEPAPKKVHNPLWSYRFKSELRRNRDFGITDDADFWLRWTETKRCPNEDGQSQPGVASHQLGNPAIPKERLPTDYREGTYKLVLYQNKYGPFSNTGWWRQHSMVPRSETEPMFHFSVEHYHNSIHNYSGTDFSVDPKIKKPVEGQMSHNSVAGFDPLFWLHHCQVDRIYALWQAVHYQEPFGDQLSERSRLPPVASMEAMDEATTSLRPFYMERSLSAGESKYEVWTNSMVQNPDSRGPNIWDYGYTYPEIPRRITSHRELQSHVIREVYLQYHPLNQGAFHFRDDDPILKKLAHGLDDPYRREWIVILRVKRYLVKRNFSIFFFLGKPSEKSHEWITSPHLVGTFSTFKSEPDVCANCKKQEEEDVTMKGAVDITNALYHALARDSIDAKLYERDKIEEYLAEKLEWRMLNHETREAVDLEKVLKIHSNGLNISVVSFLLPYPTPVDGFPDPEGPDKFRSGPSTPLDLDIYKPINHALHVGVTAPKRNIGGRHLPPPSPHGDY